MKYRSPIKSLCIVIAGGDVNEHIIHPKGALVVCADCGYRHALAQGIKPDAIVGDFDSWTEELPKGVALVKHPPEKDDTDTWLAIEYGRSKGRDNFIIYGAFGGDRIDHTIANLQLLYRMAAEGLSGHFRYRNQNVFLQDFSHDHELEMLLGGGARFSLFALTDVCTDVSIENAKYPLAHAKLRNSYPLGVSNEVAEDCDHVIITANSGMMLVVTENQSQES